MSSLRDILLKRQNAHDVQQQERQQQQDLNPSYHLTLRSANVGDCWQQRQETKSGKTMAGGVGCKPPASFVSSISVTNRIPPLISTASTVKEASKVFRLPQEVFVHILSFLRLFAPIEPFKGLCEGKGSGGAPSAVRIANVVAVDTPPSRLLHPLSPPPLRMSQLAAIALSTVRFHPSLLEQRRRSRERRMARPNHAEGASEEEEEEGATMATIPLFEPHSLLWPMVLEAMAFAEVFIATSATAAVNSKNEVGKRSSGGGGGGVVGRGVTKRIERLPQFHPLRRVAALWTERHCLPCHTSEEQQQQRAVLWGPLRPQENQSARARVAVDHHHDCRNCSADDDFRRCVAASHYCAWQGVRLRLLADACDSVTPTAATATAAVEEKLRRCARRLFRKSLCIVADDNNKGPSLSPTLYSLDDGGLLNPIHYPSHLFSFVLFPSPLLHIALTRMRLLKEVMTLRELGATRGGGGKEKGRRVVSGASGGGHETSSKLGQKRAREAETEGTNSGGGGGDVEGRGLVSVSLVSATRSSSSPSTAVAGDSASSHQGMRLPSSFSPSPSPFSSDPPSSPSSCAHHMVFTFVCPFHCLRLWATAFASQKESKGGTHQQTRRCSNTRAEAIDVDADDDDDDATSDASATTTTKHQLTAANKNNMNTTNNEGDATSAKLVAGMKHFADMLLSLWPRRSDVPQWSSLSASSKSHPLPPPTKNHLCTSDSQFLHCHVSFSIPLCATCAQKCREQHHQQLHQQHMGSATSSAATAVQRQPKSRTAAPHEGSVSTSKEHRILPPAPPPCGHRAVSALLSAIAAVIDSPIDRTMGWNDIVAAARSNSGSAAGVEEALQSVLKWISFAKKEGLECGACQGVGSGKEGTREDVILSTLSVRELWRRVGLGGGGTHAEEESTRCLSDFDFYCCGHLPSSAFYLRHQHQHDHHRNASAEEGEGEGEEDVRLCAEHSAPPFQATTPTCSSCFSSTRLVVAGGACFDSTLLCECLCECVV